MVAGVLLSWVNVSPAGATVSTTATTQLAALSHSKYQCGGDLCVTVVFDGLLGHNVQSMSVIRDPSLIGHYEFFGPAGHISNSVDQRWGRGAYRYTRFMTGNKGALWCARFWVYNPQLGWRNASGNICVRG